MEERQHSVAVVGLGFIGLPLALSYALEGVDVTGIDVNEGLVHRINSGETDLQESHRGSSIREILAAQLEAGRFRATTDYARGAASTDTYLVTVGIPVDGGEVDFAPLDGCIASLGAVLKPGDLVILRSTLVPGTTTGRVLPALERASGLQAGRDFSLAYSSERIAEGRAFQEFRDMPLALGGIDSPSAERARRVLGIVTTAEIVTSDIATIETSKILENLQRDINIAISQEFARLAEGLGIDTYEMIRVANTHRRVNLLTPGPGVGGYCLPYALHYLTPRTRELALDLPLANMARSINEETPVRVVDRLEALLARTDRTIAGARVALLGLAMKDYSGDDRESPALVMAGELVRRGADLRAHDPVVPDGRAYTYPSPGEALRGADALIIAARQERFHEMNWPELLDLMAPHPVIMDTRHLLGDGDLREDALVWRI